MVRPGSDSTVKKIMVEPATLQHQYKTLSDWTVYNANVIVPLRNYL